MLRPRLTVALAGALIITGLSLVTLEIHPAAADVNEAPTNPDQAKISAGYYHACVVTASGGVRCWGYNNYGLLGDGTTTYRTAPVDVRNADGTLLSNVSTIATGQYHTCALLNDSTVSCWGRNGSGELGDGTREMRTSPVHVRNADGTVLANVTAISLGQNTSCALTTATTVKCWGSNTYGELGIGTTTLSPSPVDVHTASDDSSPLTGITAISAGHTFVCAITTTQSVKCWGRNQHGTLGDGTAVDKSTPVDVHTSAADSDPLTGITAISAGSAHTCALTTTNTVKCWGVNGSQQLGDNTITKRTTPVDALNADGSNLSDLTAISAAHHSCGLTSASSVKCWGYNNYGQVGDGTNTISLPVTDVLATGESSGGQALASISAVTTGANFTCALTSSSSVKCWGHNGNGQLGDGTLTGRNTPVDVLPPADTTPPTATITRAGSGTLGYGDTDTITITLSETASDFDVGDISVINATLSAFSGSGTTYTATLTPDPNTTGTITLDIASGTFTDTAGNNNTAATQLTITVDTTPPTTTTSTTTTTTTSTTTTLPATTTTSTTTSTTTTTPVAPSPATTTSTTAPPSSTTTTVPIAPVVEPPTTVPPGGALAVIDGRSELISAGEPRQQSGMLTVTITHPDGRVLAMSFEALATAGVEVRRTQPVTVRGSFYPADTPIQVWIHSQPELVAETSTDATGAFETTFYPPADISPGAHILQVISGREPAVASTSIGVTIAAEPEHSPAPITELPRTGHGQPLVALGILLIAAGLLLTATHRRPTDSRPRHDSNVRPAVEETVALSAELPVAGTAAP